MENKQIKIIVTGGGTAGHVTPLLAVVDELKHQAPNSVIRYIGQGSDRKSKQLIESNKNIDKQYNIFAGKLRRFHGRSLSWYLSHPSLILRNIRDILLVVIGILQSLYYLIGWRPAVVFVKGGFVGLPVGLAAGLLRINIVTHDSDSLPGLTNRILSKFAKKSAVAMPKEVYAQYYRQESTIETGVPVDQKYFHSKSAKQTDLLRSKYKISKNTKVLTFVGGSLGAVRLNDALLAVVAKLIGDSKGSVFIFWATGKPDFKRVSNYIKTNKLDRYFELAPYFSELSDIFTISDVVVSRSGATTIAELAALGRPTVLVPNPVLTGGHQTKNAKVLEEKQAALVIDEDELSENALLIYEAINQLLSNHKLSQSLSSNIKQFAYPNAAQHLATIILNEAK
ncbi:UDP-N-acetylglucosamine--N-acetylmuramyl-(pentapeptide) pyrophosphoryl-undecaprenol N-acetylglucosamine transferase [Candidatus Saccharibacteria bacterium]|jgi:UDP-N-acetylglucosamine--N-acetylmuramyl-(pentapeptide) pyrophosphoryl-undecaprenol N-acetylglucosamine transferase|nr:UDP-N-acetylglucosamine--N-acetylmuramyl-(pentapeptide) pyrophosphoryl-undecaprenol N-acetylglucosamine transferase [Candidatus Saccharibacteria bacterium]